MSPGGLNDFTSPKAEIIGFLTQPAMRKDRGNRENPKKRIWELEDASRLVNLAKVPL
jgi:hypothetical protein